jgi:hypothetical protein
MPTDCWYPLYIITSQSRCRIWNMGSLLWIMSQFYFSFDGRVINHVYLLKEIQLLCIESVFSWCFQEWWNGAYCAEVSWNHCSASLLILQGMIIESFISWKYVSKLSSWTSDMVDTQLAVYWLIDWLISIHSTTNNTRSLTIVLSKMLCTALKSLKGKGRKQGLWQGPPQNYKVIQNYHDNM